MRVVIHKNGMCRNLVVNRTWGQKIQYITTFISQSNQQISLKSHWLNRIVAFANVRLE